MSPGPTTAINSASRLRAPRERRFKLPARPARREKVSVNVTQVFIALRLWKSWLIVARCSPDVLFFRLYFCAQAAHHIVHGDRAHGTVALIHYCQAAQIVFIKKLEDFVVLRIRSH